LRPSQCREGSPAKLPSKRAFWFSTTTTDFDEMNVPLSAYARFLQKAPKEFNVRTLGLTPMRLFPPSLPGKVGLGAIILAAFGLICLAYIAQQQSVRQVPQTTLISIPEGSDIEPSAFNVTTLLTASYRFPVNITLILGVNNTVQWRNADDVTHTVSSYVVPKEGQAFNSDLIPPGGTFEVTLTAPGTYRYACIWHPWVAGQITVKTG
jgi:hypothetical protein